MGWGGVGVSQSGEHAPLQTPPNPNPHPGHSRTIPVTHPSLAQSIPTSAWVVVGGTGNRGIAEKMMQRCKRKREKGRGGKKKMGRWRKRGRDARTPARPASTGTKQRSSLQSTNREASGRKANPGHAITGRARRAPPTRPPPPPPPPPLARPPPPSALRPPRPGIRGPRSPPRASARSPSPGGGCGPGCSAVCGRKRDRALSISISISLSLSLSLCLHLYFYHFLSISLSISISISISIPFSLRVSQFV